MSSANEPLAHPQREHDLVRQLDHAREQLARADAERLRAESTLGQMHEAYAALLSELRERRQTEAALRRYERIVSATPDWISLVDRNYVYQMVNQSYLRLNNKTADQIVGHTVPDLVGPSVFAELIRPRLDEVLAGSQVQYQAWFDYPGAGRRLMEVTYAPFSEADGTITGVIVSGRDITEQAQLEQTLRAQEARLEQQWAFLASVLETLDEGVMVTDRHGNLLLCNQAMERIAGFARGKIQAPELMALFHTVAPTSPDTMVDEAHRARNALRELERKDGDRRQLLVSQRWLTRDDQPLLLTSCRDVTDQQAAEAAQRRFEQKLQEAQRLESLGVLAGGIAHDFNNLLAIIIGNTDLALVELPPESPSRARLRQIASAASQAADLTRQMLTYAGQGRLLVEPVDLNEVIQNDRMLIEASVGKGVALRYDLAPAMPQVIADLSQIRQVLMNLVINASEAIGPDDGTITIHTSTVELSAANLAGFRTGGELAQGPFIRLTVRDTGGGIDPAVLERIFDPFFTTKFIGRGLGLAVVLGIVQRHRGALHAESVPGEGALFTVLLPAAAEQPAATLSPASGPASRASGSVLVVDDELGVQLLAADMLRHLGFTPVAVRDGPAALVELRARRGDLVAALVDLTMPGMSGVEVFDAIRQLAPELPVIVMSGYSVADVAQRFTDRGRAAFLQKPFELDTLRVLLGQALSAEDARNT